MDIFSKQDDRHIQKIKLIRAKKRAEWVDARENVPMVLLDQGLLLQISCSTVLMSDDACAWYSWVQKEIAPAIRQDVPSAVKPLVEGMHACLSEIGRRLQETRHNR